MKKLINNYSFDKNAKTIVFSDYNEIDLESILIITNVSRNIIVYSFADNSVGGTVSNNVLTLNYDTSAMSNEDKLQIFIDDGKEAITQEDIQQMELINSLRLLVVALNNPPYIDKSANQIRAQITGSLSALTTLTTLTNIGSFPGDHLQRMNNLTAWSVAVRGRIS